jgi:hypothetical protein
MIELRWQALDLVHAEDQRLHLQEREVLWPPKIVLFVAMYIVPHNQQLYYSESFRFEVSSERFCKVHRVLDIASFTQ